MSPSHLKIFLLSSTLLTTAAAFFLIYKILLLRREHAQLRKEIGLARCQAKIADTLNGAAQRQTEKIKHVARLLAEEGKDNWKCRIVIHGEESFLPPSGGKLGFQLPMVVDDKTVGTLIITPGVEELEPVNWAFFDAVTRALALFIYKERMWEDFHAEMERLRASLLLHAETISATHPASERPDTRTVEHMLGMLGLVQRTAETPKPRY